MKKVAFICVHNSCRSQIAEAICRKYRPDLEAYSEGIEIKPIINQDAVRILLKNYNIDISNYHSKLIKDIPSCNIYVSMGCNVSCPFIGRDYDYNFNIEDPTNKDDEAFIQCIEEIKKKIMEL